MGAKKNIAVFGAGKIGRLVVNLLADCNDYHVTVLDVQNMHTKRDQCSSQKFLKNVQYRQADFASRRDIEQGLVDQDYVLSCAPFYCNVEIAKQALRLKVNYLDLTEDIKTTAAIKKFAQNSQNVFIPQCGLAPGFITIVANDLVRQFDTVDVLKMRVGALPMFPHNSLKYNLTWSTEGLINEYCNPCEVIENKKLEIVAALEGKEMLSLDGQEYEAFHTSGGLGTLAESLLGKVENMNYKSIRYPGHRDLLFTLLHDLKFIDDREGLKKVFERSLPYTKQDVVIIFVTVIGRREGKLTQKSYVKKIYHSEIAGEHWGAIQVTTAAGICAVLDLHVHSKLPLCGFVRQENISYEEFIKNRFGKYYI